MIETTDPVLSSYVYHTLDIIGYSKGIQDDRVLMMDLFVANAEPSGKTILAVGSVSEGVANVMESDTDLMMVYNEVICVDNPTYSTGFIELKPDYSNVSPGYVKLTTADFIQEGSSVSRGHLLGRSKSGRPYVSSSRFKNDVEYDFDLSYDDRFRDFRPYASGPALTIDGTMGVTELNSELSVPSVKIQNDLVAAFHFFGSDALNALKRWAARKRFQNWPPKCIIDAVTISNVYVVPVGEVGSETEDIEWRISFSEAEKILITNANSSQYKLYVLLKMITKEVIKPVCPSVFSYMVKNVMLWTCERVPSIVFGPTQLIRLTMHALWFFRHSLQNNHLPNYILPERNLIAGRINGEEKVTLISLLSTLLEENERIILRLPILCEYLPVMRDMPHICTLYGMWRHEVETLQTVCTMHFAPSMNGEDFIDKSFILDFMKNAHAIDPVVVLLYVVCPEFESMASSGKLEEAHKLYYERIKNMYMKRL